MAHKVSSPATPGPERSSAFWGTILGNPLKWVSLLVLIVQNVALVTLMRYSRTRKQEGARYLSSTAVFFQEIVKLFCSFLLVWHESGSLSEAWRLVRHHLLGSPSEMLKISIPSLLYAVQGNLVFGSVSNLSSAVHAVMMQLKILSTAIMSVVILGTELGHVKWISLILLTFAVILIQLPRDSLPEASRSPAEVPRESSLPVDPGDAYVMSATTLGMTCSILAVWVSALAGVYLEKIVKQSHVTLWMRNLQLAAMCAPTSLAIALAKDGQQIAEAGLLAGYSPLVWLVVILSAAGGLLVAVVLKHADNILKCFATAVSIILTCSIAQLMGDFTPDLLFVVGVMLVLAATALYTIGPCTKVPCFPGLDLAGTAAFSTEKSSPKPQVAVAVLKVPDVQIGPPAVLLGVV